MDNINIINLKQEITSDDKMKQYKEYKKEYNKQRYNEKKELILEHQKNYYKKKLITDPDFRNNLNERTKTRYNKMKETKEPKQRGRPRTKEPTEPKPVGRPRKY
jgi:hypothetical protein